MIVFKCDLEGLQVCFVVVVVRLCVDIFAMIGMWSEPQGFPGDMWWCRCRD